MLNTSPITPASFPNIAEQALYRSIRPAEVLTKLHQTQFAQQGCQVPLQYIRNFIEVTLAIQTPFAQSLVMKLRQYLRKQYNLHIGEHPLDALESAQRDLYIYLARLILHRHEEQMRQYPHQYPDSRMTNNAEMMSCMCKTPAEIEELVLQAWNAAYDLPWTDKADFQIYLLSPLCIDMIRQEIHWRMDLARRGEDERNISTPCLTQEDWEELLSCMMRRFPSVASPIKLPQ